MNRLLPVVTVVLITVFALPGIPEEKTDGLLEEKIVRPGETYTVETISPYREIQGKTTWIKVKNPEYSQAEGRRELFNKRR